MEDSILNELLFYGVLKVDEAKTDKALFKCDIVARLSS
jgi:hypothetical protein